jgi:hypothetical protein
VIGDRWGVTEQETLLEYPCDAFVPRPGVRAWRAVDVAAPAAVVWAWVGQVRVAPYSYDGIDNRGQRSPRQLLGLAEPHVGEAFTASGGRKLGRIVAVGPGHRLTARIMGAYMSYVLVSTSPNTTRLLLKVAMETNPVVGLGLSIGDLVMARRQLLNFKNLAEGRTG